MFTYIYHMFTYILYVYICISNVYIYIIIYMLFDFYLLLEVQDLEARFIESSIPNWSNRPETNKVILIIIKYSLAKYYHTIFLTAFKSINFKVLINYPSKIRSTNRESAPVVDAKALSPIDLTALRNDNIHTYIHTYITDHHTTPSTVF